MSASSTVNCSHSALFLLRAHKVLIQYECYKYFNSLLATILSFCKHIACRDQLPPAQYCSSLQTSQLTPSHKQAKACIIIILYNYSVIINPGKKIKAVFFPSVNFNIGTFWKLSCSKKKKSELQSVLVNGENVIFWKLTYLMHYIFVLAVVVTFN